MDDEMFVMDIKHGSAPSGNAHPVEATALLGNAAVLIWNDVAPEGRDQFYRWHDREHIPERLALPGFLRGRRLACTGHSPEWLTIYEADDLDVLTSPEYLARLNAPTPATTATLQALSQHVARDLFDPAHGGQQHRRLRAHPAHRDAGRATSTRSCRRRATRSSRRRCN